MMSDLAEIAAAAGIAIIDSEVGDRGDVKNVGGGDFGDVGDGVVASHTLPAESGDWSEMSQIQEWDVLFRCRYSDSDPDYVSGLESAEAMLHPPCIENFSCRRPRNDSRNWNRDSHGPRRYNEEGGRGGYRDRGNYRDDWNRGGRAGGGGWSQGDYRDRPRNHGDYHQRGYGNQHQRGYGDQQPRGYGDQRQRGHGDQRGYGDQRYRNREGHRERSPQR